MSEEDDVDKPTDEEERAADAKFLAKLTALGLATCSQCGRAIDRGDVSWNDGSTLWTPMTWAQIQCQKCDTEIAHWASWYPGGRECSFPEFVQSVLPDINRGI